MLAQESVTLATKNISMKIRVLVDGFIIHSFYGKYCRQYLCHPEITYEYSIKKTPEKEPVIWIGESVPIHYMVLLFFRINYFIHLMRKALLGYLVGNQQVVGHSSGSFGNRGIHFEREPHHVTIV